VRVTRLSSVSLRASRVKRTASSAGTRASSSEQTSRPVGPPPRRIPSFVRAERFSRWVIEAFLREGRVSSVEAQLGGQTPGAASSGFRSGYQSAEGVKTSGGLLAGVWHPLSRLSAVSRVWVAKGPCCFTRYGVLESSGGPLAFRCQGAVRAVSDHRSTERSLRVNALKGAGSL
jgi:hypothetical protein